MPTRKPGKGGDPKPKSHHLDEVLKEIEEATREWAESVNSSGKSKS